MVQTRRLVLALFVGAGLAACSGSSGPTINTFTATPANLPAGGGSVTLAWSVTGATSLSIDQSVGSVTPLDTGSKSVNVTATTTFTLSATDSSGTSTKTAQVTVAAGPATITVAGTVVDSNGAAFAGQTVLITSGTFSQSVVSDSTGAFSVPNVPTPYDATVIDSGGQEAIQYVGLTRADPSLTDLSSSPTPLTATVAGSFTGGTYPESASINTSILFVSPQAMTTFSDPGDGTFSSTVDWAGPSTTTGVLYALQVHTVAGLPTDFPGYGSLNLSLTNGESLAGQTVALSGVTTGTISGTITAPAGFTVGENIAALAPASGVLLGFLDDGSPSASFSYTTPSIANTSIFFETEVIGTGVGGTAFKKTVSATATGLSISPPAPPSLVLPVDVATDVTLTTPFTVTSYPGVFIFIISPAGTGPTFVVITAATTATIPDLTAAGIPLPASAGYNWMAYGVGPSTSVDSTAATGGLLTLLEFSDGYYSVTPERSLTTGP